MAEPQRVYAATYQKKYKLSQAQPDNAMRLKWGTGDGMTQKAGMELYLAKGHEGFTKTR
ncbi:D-serine dehydratase [Salmonella enterica subsp. houtenae]|uniref:D-serine dehydratase n=5 Tax=Salmonella enterica TaxID=28901 RepID=A0A609YRR9_SALHO|nr:D-serine dehydratase [Salmonella enterica subsp. enterica]EAB2654894.1 D-serine dehydratase [Salmonella enterica]EAU5131818.1 D-serine dehydratase [Salmonella enterica subsp. enterica serovar Oranienburg]ECC1597806.1 D-serine dehydratase [Salmonella enterica subsp. houtenae]ECT3980212.1 D-serine dehydratase [Salmonella enterica subsp. houtenae serovar 53:z4,z23:-]EDT6512298.1 D-serine dehydratase [Salmonella enterica subsp. enterica serovar Tallahassee]EDX1438078.1 D-serine dehydratase [Sa